MGDLSALVRDPDFVGLPLAQQRAALSYATGDKDFSALSDRDTQNFLSKARNATPTKFEQERDPKNFKESGVGAFAKDVASLVPGMAEMVGRGMSDPVAAGVSLASKIAGDDQERKAEGRSLPYRVAAGVGTAVTPLNVQAQEEAANVGNTGAVVGHTAAAVGTATAPSLVRASMARMRAPAPSPAPLPMEEPAPVQTSKVSLNREPLITPEPNQPAPAQLAPEKTTLGDLMKGKQPTPRSKYASFADDREDIALKDLMNHDMWQQYYKGLAEERRAMADGMSMDKPKWLMQAEVEGEQAKQKIIDEAEQKAKTPAKYTETKPSRAATKPDTATTDDMTDVLKRSIAAVNARKGKK